MDVKYSYRDLAGADWHEKVKWCSKNLHHGGNYEPKWYRQYPFIIFEDEKEYVWFKLVWG